MNNRYKVSLNIGVFVFTTGVIFFIISLYYYQDYSSIKQFFTDFLSREINIFLLLGIFILSVISWLFSYYIVSNIFTDIENYNIKLKDYNHFLAHELKTPIAVINSNLEVLEYGFDKEISIHSKKELRNMTSIIDGLLNFSESFNNLEKKEINVENFIKSYINFTQNIKIINSEFNFSIITDEILFERILKNLIENALKYSPNKELSIYINSERIVFENEVYKEIDNLELEKIFDKFYTKSCNENSGSGLGLPMIKEIAKSLGFELIVNFVDNKFRVELIFNNN